MIFVILGIFILILSFVIALVSLLREQKKTTEAVWRKVSEKGVGEKVERVVQQIPQRTDETLGLPKKEEPAMDAEEPFPWEEKPEEIALASDEGKVSENQPGGENSFDIAEEARHPVQEQGPLQATKKDEKYNPSLPSGGIVEVSMKDIIEKSKSGD